jgi:flagellar protein FliO/FliZ
MLGEFLLRLAIALPLVCGLAALCLWAVKRGRLRLPGLLAGGRVAGGRATDPQALLEVLEVRALSPGARLAVVRFGGQAHLVGVAGQTITMLAPASEAVAAPAAGVLE